MIVDIFEVIRNTGKSVEVIVVDDGSVDATNEIVKSLQKKESERGMKFLGLASNLKLGVSDINKIKLEKIDLV